MKRPMSVVKIVVLSVLAVLVLCPLTWFVWTRFCVDQYSISPDWSTITFRGDTYVPEEKVYASDEAAQAELAYMTSHVGKSIGVAVFPKRTFSDLIWPVWVMEYDGDKLRDRIFVRGLMDVGNVYVRQTGT